MRLKWKSERKKREGRWKFLSFYWFNNQKCVHIHSWKNKKGNCTQSTNFKSWTFLNFKSWNTCCLCFVLASCLVLSLVSCILLSYFYCLVLSSCLVLSYLVLSCFILSFHVFVLTSPHTHTPHQLHDDNDFESSEKAICFVPPTSTRRQP